MAQRRCFGCMELTDRPVCKNCGTSEEERNQPHQLPRGTILAERFLVGKVLEEFRDGICYLAFDKSRGKAVRLLEYFPKDAAQREGLLVKPTAATFTRGAARFRRISDTMSRNSRLTEVSGIEMTFEENDTLYRVCEQIRGSTLEKYVEMRGGFLLPEEAMRILDGIMEALDAFHADGFSHGGLSLETIVLNSQGGPQLPWVGMNPQRDPGEDVKSLCRIFLECLDRDPQEPPTRIPGLPKPIAAALEKGLSPEGGFATAGELRAAMRSGVPAQAPQQTPPAQASQAPRQRPTAPPARASQAPARRRPPEPEPQRQPRKKQPRKEPGDTARKVGVLVLAAVVLLILAGLWLLLVNKIHVWVPADCEHPMTCSICGRTYGEALGHVWWEPDCEHSRQCSRCGALEGPILGHDWQDAACETPKTCKRCGKTEGEPLGHNWLEADCVSPKRCARCGKVEGEALGHDWQDGDPGQPQVCARCGQTRSDYLPTVTWKRPSTGEYEGIRFRASVLTEPLKDVESLMLHFEITDMEGPVNCRLLYQKPDGTWVECHTFQWSGGEAVEEVRFPEPVEISAIAVISSDGSVSFKAKLDITDVCFRERADILG